MKTRQSDNLVLIGIGRPGYDGFRKATDTEIKGYEESKKDTFLDADKLSKTMADKARLDEMTGN